MKGISHVHSPQGCGFSQIYLKQCKELNVSRLLRLISLGWLGLDLQSRFSYFSSRAQRHSWWSQNKAYSWKKFKQLVFFWHLYGPSWLLQLGWHRKTCAMSLMVGWVGPNEDTPIFNQSSRVCPLICQHRWDNTGGNQTTDWALKLFFVLCIYCYFKLGALTSSWLWPLHFLSPLRNGEYCL